MRGLLLVVLAGFSITAQAATYYTRNDGNNATCNGLTNASAASAPNCAFATPSQAINVASCGDVLKFLAGDTWDGTVTLPNKSCAVSNPITITSTATLPNRRVTPADASLMPRFRTLGTDGHGAFTTAANAGWWILDGLEITDNAGMSTVNALVEFGETVAGVHDITLTRSWVHQKETGTNYERSALRAVRFEGVGLTLTRNYLDTIGSPYGTTEPHNSTGLLCVACQTVTMSDNYVNYWWNGIFLGGGDTAAQNTATLSSASTTSATFGSVVGTLPAVGTFIRFSVVGTATLSNSGCSPNLARLTGGAWVTADGNTNGFYGDSILLTSQVDGSSGVARLMTINEGAQTATTISASSAVCAVPNGTVNYVIYQTAKVTGVVGSVVTYNPLGTTAGINYDVNALNKTPASAAWNNGDQGRVVDITATSNTFNNDVAYATYVKSIGRGCPKGGYEIKNVDRFLYEFNSITGYPAVLAMTAANQNGTAPWTIVNNVVMRSNWIKPDASASADCIRQAFLIADDAYLNTITPTQTVTITNNLITGGVRELADIKNGNVWTITQNTSINSASSNVGPNALLSAQVNGIPALNFTNNIGDLVCYGLKDFDSAFVSPTVLSNVFVDTNVGCTGGINVNSYGVGSGLPPIPTAFSQVGFTNQAGDNYLLTGASPYKAAGVGGVDPGVAWNTPGAPWLQGQSAGSGSIKGGVVLRGKIIVR